MRELKELKNLNLEERARKVVERQYNKTEVHLAARTQNLIELHVTGDKSSKGYPIFETFFKSLLQKDKHERFESLIGEKMPTAEICENMFTELKKVFSAQNKKISYGLPPEEEAKVLKNKRLNPEYFVQNKLWERMKFSPNDILIIKVDEDNIPYPEFIDLSIVCDACSDDNGKLHYVLYKYNTYTTTINNKEYEEQSYYYIDWEGFVEIKERFYKKESINSSQSTIEKDYETVESDLHGYDYCPAIFVYPKINNPKTNKLLVNSPLLKVLPRLDWLGFFIPSKKYFDTYATFPIITKFEDKEDYQTEEGNEAVGDRLVADPDNYPELGSRIIQNQTNTKTSKWIGAGSIIEVPTPDGETLPNILEAVKFISADYRNLDYVNRYQKELIEEVFYSVVGKGAEFISKFSASPEQLENSYDSRKQILSEIREVVERVHKFYANTVLSTVYGDQYDKDRTAIFYGDVYYLMTPQQVALQYDKFVKSGVPESLKLDQLKTLVYTTYSNSPKQLYRGMVLLNAEPHPTHSLQTIMTMAQTGIIDPLKTFTKLNFNDLIEEYELNFGDIGDNEGVITTSQMVVLLNEYFTTKYTEAGSPTYTVQQEQATKETEDTQNTQQE